MDQNIYSSMLLLSHLFCQALHQLPVTPDASSQDFETSDSVKGMLFNTNGVESCQSLVAHPARHIMITDVQTNRKPPKNMGSWEGGRGAGGGGASTGMGENIQDQCTAGGEFVSYLRGGRGGGGRIED